MSPQTLVTPAAVANGEVIHRDLDQHVVVRIQRGDPAALAELYDRMAGRVYRIAVVMTASAPVAADITRAVFSQARRHPESLRHHHSQLGAYLSHQACQHAARWRAQHTRARRAIQPSTARPAEESVDTRSDHALGSICQVAAELPTPAMSPDIGTEHIGTEHIGTEHIGTEHIGTEHIGTEHIGTEQVGTEHVGTGGVEHTAPLWSRQVAEEIEATLREDVAIGGLDAAGAAELIARVRARAQPEAGHRVESTPPEGESAGDFQGSAGPRSGSVGFGDLAGTSAEGSPGGAPHVAEA